MRVLLVLLLIVVVASAQMLPGSTNGQLSRFPTMRPSAALKQLYSGHRQRSIPGIIANGKGGLGRYIRHLEGRDRSSYYNNGNEFGYYGYAPNSYNNNFGFFGWSSASLFFHFLTSSTRSQCPLVGSVHVHTCYDLSPHSALSAAANDQCITVINLFWYLLAQSETDFGNGNGSKCGFPFLVARDLLVAIVNGMISPCEEMHFPDLLISQRTEKRTRHAMESHFRKWNLQPLSGKIPFILRLYDMTDWHFCPSKSGSSCWLSSEISGFLHDNKIFLYYWQYKRSELIFSS